VRCVARGRPRAPLGPLPVMVRGGRGCVRDDRVVQLDGRLPAQHVPPGRVRPAAPIPHPHRHRTLVGHVQVQHHGAPRPPGRPHQVVDRLPAAVLLVAVAVAAAVTVAVEVEVVAVAVAAVRQQSGTAVPGPGRREQRAVVLRVHRHGLSAQSMRAEQRPAAA